MTVSEKAFLSVLSAYFNGNAEAFVKKETLAEVINLAKMHNVLPLVFEMLSKSCAKDERFLPEKNAALRIYSAQCVKDERFLSLYRTLLDNELMPLCVKGITLRSLYQNGALRPSTDEDLLIKKEDMPLFERLMKENGFELKTEGENEKTYIERKTSLIIEAHTSLFSEGGKLGKTLEELFFNPFEETETVVIEKTPVATLGVQKGLLYLVCHAFKHFIRCGVGIRQVCDIAVYMRKHKEKLDIPLLKSELSKLNAAVFFEGVVNIAVKYLGFDDLAFFKTERIGDEDSLAEDILRGGIYGKSEEARLHSAPFTLFAVNGKGKAASLFSALFPNFKKLSAEYPMLKKSAALYPAFAFLRIVKYLFDSSEKENGSAMESIKIAEERKKLLKKYEIISERRKAAEGTKWKK